MALRPLKPRPRVAGRFLLACVALLGLGPVARAAAQDAAPAASSEAVAPATLRFEGLRIRGVDGELLANLERKLSLARLKPGTAIRPQRFDYLLRVLPREAAEALEPFGYYSPSVRSEADRRGETRAVVVWIEPGEQVRVRQRNVVFSGAAADDKLLQPDLKRFAPGPGEPLLHARYEASKAELQRRLGERGYFDAQLVDARVEVTRALAAADIHLRWRSGERFNYGPISIQGSHLREGLLDPLLPFAPEQRFHQRRLLELQRRLADLDYFGRIDIQPRERPRDDEGEPLPGVGSAAEGIGIEVELAPAKRNVYVFGASYGSDTGGAIKLGYVRRWLNAAGHKLDSELLLGEQRSAARVAYRIPAFERFTGWWTGSLKLRQEPFAAIDSDILELAATRDGRWRGNLITGGLQLRRERYAGEGATLVYPELSVERKVVNDALYPTRGFLWRLTLRSGRRALGSEFDFGQALATAMLVRGIGERDRVLLRAEAGSTTGTDFERLPPSLRFYAGGDRSVRGYDYQALGPRFEGDQRVGGRHLLSASVEWERMFTAQWGGALFVDAGNAFNDRFEAAVGVGVGLRWRSPVGPVRVDLAHGLDDPERAIRLHFQLGPEL